MAGGLAWCGTKIKRHSRSVLSVILAVCMLVSCMTVGLIATDAAQMTGKDETVGARVDTDGTVGWSSGDNFHYSLNSGTWADVDLSSGSGELAIGTANSSLEFGFKVGGNWYAKHSSQSNPGYGSSTATYTAKKGSGISNYTLSSLPVGTYKIELVGTSGDDLTYRFYKKSNPVCTGLSLSASPSTLTSAADTFTLTATASGTSSRNITYNFYAEGNNTPIYSETTTATTITTTSLTQGSDYSKKYYVTAELTNYDTVTSDKITIKNTSVSGTKTIYVGVVSFILDEDFDAAGTINPTGDILSSLKLRYWGTGIDTSDADSPTYTGITKLHTPTSGWSGEGDKTFYMYSFSIPSTATGMKAWLDLSSDRWFGGDGDATTKNTVYIYRYSGEQADYANESYTASDLTIAAVDHATVTATYNGVKKGEGETFADIYEGMSITISVTPDKGYECTAVTGVYSGGSTDATGSGSEWTLTMPAHDTEVSATIQPVSWKRIYFNNYYTRYAMVTAYVQYSDGTKPLGIGQTMTRLPNSNTWYIDVPGDVEYITFIGDEGVNTNDSTQYPSTPQNMMNIPWGTYTNPKYNPGKANHNPPTVTNGGTWGEYTDRTNEYTVSAGTTLDSASQNNIFTGITATLYDYFVDGEVPTTKENWLTGISTSEKYDYSTNNGSKFKWNPYTKLNDALDSYARETSTAVPLYFGNFYGVATGTTNDMIKVQSGTYKDYYYTNWSYEANNSQGLSGDHKAATGLSGKTLQDSNIHYYSSSDTTNENGAIMAMFDEDFLSGENIIGKNLATILRASTFPVRVDTIESAPTELYLDTSGFTNWENGNAVMKADFYNGNTTESTKRLVTATKVCNHVYKVTIPQGYSKVQWWRMDPSNLNGTPWDYGTDGDIPKDSNCVFSVTGWKKAGSWTNSYTDGDGNTQTITLGSHTYYEFDSTNGKDNAYITGIDRDNHTATIDYYKDTSNKKVHAANGAGGSTDGEWGFFPFDYDRAGSASGDTTLAHDLGFGMKLEIPFTLEKNGEFADGTHQVFDFSGDDDLWVFVDGKLVLDLGGDHKRTSGSIDFADKKITNLVEGGNYTINGTRNGDFEWFDNSNENQPHTLTIYYLERGMFDSNLKFGFSFHAIPNQYKTEKKLKTSNINGGFYKTNNQSDAASNESAELTAREGRFISKFEETYQSEFFTVEQKVNSNSIEGKTYTIGSSTNTVGSSSSYQLKNDDIAYFVREFDEDDVITLKEIFGSSNLYNYEPILTVYDDGNNKKEFVTVPSVTNPGEVSGNNTDGFSFKFTHTSTDVNALGNLNIRGLFTNQMKQHSLTLRKEITGEEDLTTQFTFRIKFKFGDYDYISYPLEILKNGEKTALSDTGEVTITSDDVVEIPKIPENAKIQIEEVNIASTYNYNNISVTGATATIISNGAQFTMGESDITATVNNSQFSGFTVTKQLQYSPSGTMAEPTLVDYPDTESEFRIKVETSSDNSTWNALANKTFTSSDTSRAAGTLTTDANGITTIKRGEKLSFEDIQVDTHIRVTEDTERSTYASDNFTTPTVAHMPKDYQYVKTEAYNGDTSVGSNYTNGNYKGTKFQLSSGRVDVTITNIKPRYRWIAMYKHTTRSVDIANKTVDKHSIWGDVWYNSDGVFTVDELINYTEFAMVKNDNDASGDDVYGIRFKDNDSKAAFLLNKTPYQDNFKETVEWNLSTADVGFYYNSTDGSQLSITPTETLHNNEKVNVRFRLPCRMSVNHPNDEWLPDETTVGGTSALQDGVPKAEFADNGLPDESSDFYTDFGKTNADYAEWYTLNNVLIGQSETPKFVSAPEVVYDVDTGTQKYFQYWSVRTMTNDSSDSVEYTKCYYKEFNYVFYQSSIVYAVYGDTQQNHNVIASSVESSANLTFLETSRNQWNQQPTGTKIQTDFGGANNVRHGDRLFVDFVIDLHYVNKDGQNVLLNSITDTSNYKAGLLIETVRELNSNEVDTVNKKMLKTDKEIASSFKASDNITAKNNALAYLATNMSDKTTYLNSNINLSKLDNKNQLEFAYSFANISQTAEYRTETARKTKLYRAYAYLIHKNGADDPENPGATVDVEIISEPVYFTIYDMAAITNDYDISVTQ